MSKTAPAQFSRGKLRAWRRALGRRLPQADVDAILAASQVRLPGLRSATAGPTTRGARWHLEEAILPGAALYSEARDRFGTEDALALTQLAFREEQRRQRRALERLDRTPWLYPFLRHAGRLTMWARFKPPEFSIEMQNDDRQSLDFVFRRCYYVDTLNRLGLPELASTYCRNDDFLYSGLRHAKFWRTGTIATGQSTCDFHYQRTPQQSMRRQA
jgi:hypothetical protein